MPSSFKKTVVSDRFVGQEVMDAQFYEAEITQDAIIGTPWLYEKRLGVFPHLDALAHIDENFRCCLLKSTCGDRKKSKPRRINKVWYWNRRRVDEVRKNPEKMEAEVNVKELKK